MEAVANVIIGVGINLAAQRIVFPAVLGITVSLRQNLMTSAIFTAISLIRSYFLRRLFNRIRHGLFA